MFVISEIFPQYGGDLRVAEQMILQSKLAGADAVKLQLYPSEMFYPGGERKYQELTFDDVRRLNDYATALGIDLFATAFTEERLEWCLRLDLKYLKIASRTHRDDAALVAAILAARKPTFVSVPIDADLSSIVRAEHCIYLSCVAKYPTRLDESVMPDFESSIFAGISDHTIGISAAVYAAAHGAKYLEKHFTLSHAFQSSLEMGHVGGMTMSELADIKRISFEFEVLRRAGRRR